jgi:hypothetical protein
MAFSWVGGLKGTQISDHWRTHRRPDQLSYPLGLNGALTFKFVFLIVFLIRVEIELITKLDNILSLVYLVFEKKFDFFTYCLIKLFSHI